MKNLLMAFFFIAVFSASLAAQDVGTPAPNFTHSTLDHGTISLTDYAGKVIFLFFFGHG